MIDVPPQPPAVSEQVIEQRLVQRGLDPKGFTVRYEDYLRSIEIVIKPAAGATSEHFQCIHDAAGYEIVTFADAEMYRQYIDFSTELARPEMLDFARKSLQEKGLLEGFPERKDFASDDAFAVALETHCGFEPKTALGRTEFGLIVLPNAIEPGRLSDRQWERMSCLMASLMYVSARGDDFKVGFVGNEKFRDSEGGNVQTR